MYLKEYHHIIFSTYISLIGIGQPNKLGGANRNPLNCPILDNWVFENFISDYKPFAKALQIFETCVSVTNSFCG